MNECQNGPDAPPGGTANPDQIRRRPPLLLALAVLLGAEGLLLCGGAAWVLIELVTARPASYLSGIAFLVLAALAAAWVLITAINTPRARPWIRGSAVTWQILQAAIAVTSLQGAAAVAGTGWWALLAASVAGIVLVLMPSVIAATTTHVEPAG